jgi:hypothetical protein
MRKLIIYLLLVFVAIGIAGLYGILHNQISYTVSREYFTEFKFYQFQLLNENIPERVRASMVGFMASWWMGFPIGLLAGLAGFIQKGSGRMLRISIEAIFVAAAFTLFIGLCGLVFGFFETAHKDYVMYVPEGVEHPRRFMCAGYMHNSSYLGGVLSIPIAWAYQVFRRSYPRDSV